MSNRLKLLREKATRPRRTVPILLDGEIREQIEAVEDELDRLDEQLGEADRRLAPKPKAASRRAELEAEVKDLREQAHENTLYAVVEGLQLTAFRALIGQHPPRRDGDGKVEVADRITGANSEAIGIPLARACLVGYREKPDADAPVLPLDESQWVGAKFEPGMVDFLLGYKVTHPTIEGLTAEAEPFATERQVGLLSAAAWALCVGDDAVPLSRRHSPTEKSAGE